MKTRRVQSGERIEGGSRTWLWCLSALFSLLSLVCSAQTNLISFPLSDIGQFTAPGVKVTIQMTGPFPNVIQGIGVATTPQSHYTDTTGTAWWTNLVTGNYLGIVDGAPAMRFLFHIYPTTYGTNDVFSLIGTTNLPSPVTNYYNMAQINSLLAGIAFGAGITNIVNMGSAGSGGIAITGQIAYVTFPVGSSGGNFTNGNFLTLGTNVAGATSYSVDTASLANNGFVTNGNSASLNFNGSLTAAGPLVANGGLNVYQTIGGVLGNGVNLSGNFTYNGAPILTNLVAPNMFYVTLNGKDASAVMGDQAHPFGSLTNALTMANTNPPAVIVLGPGTWPLALVNGTAISNNVSIIGQGRQRTTITYPTNGGAGFIVNGDNIGLAEFTLFSPQRNGTYNYPIIPVSGTNVSLFHVSPWGDSDCIYGSVSSNVQWRIESCDFHSGFDTVNLLATGKGTNSIYDFINCDFTVNGDTNNSFAFAGQPFRGVSVDNLTVSIRNCRFWVTNSMTNANSAAYCVQLQGDPFTSVVLSGNTFSYFSPNGEYNSQGMYWNGLGGGTPSAIVHGNYNQADFLAIFYDGIITFDTGNLQAGPAGINDGENLTGLQALQLVGTVPNASLPPYSNTNGSSTIDTNKAGFILMSASTNVFAVATNGTITTVSPYGVTNVITSTNGGLIIASFYQGGSNVLFMPTNGAGLTYNGAVVGTGGGSGAPTNNPVFFAPTVLTNATGPSGMPNWLAETNSGVSAFASNNVTTNLAFIDYGTALFNGMMTNNGNLYTTGGVFAKSGISFGSTFAESISVGGANEMYFNQGTSELRIGSTVAGLWTFNSGSEDIGNATHWWRSCYLSNVVASVISTTNGFTDTSGTGTVVVTNGNITASGTITLTNSAAGVNTNSVAVTPNGIVAMGTNGGGTISAVVLTCSTNNTGSAGVYVGNASAVAAGGKTGIYPSVETYYDFTAYADGTEIFAGMPQGLAIIKCNGITMANSQSINGSGSISLTGNIAGSSATFTGVASAAAVSLPQNLTLIQFYANIPAATGATTNWIQQTCTNGMLYWCATNLSSGGYLFNKLGTTTITTTP